MVRRIGLALLAALALIVLLIAAIFGVAQTGYGKRLITAQLSALLSTPDMTFEITDLQGFVPVDMRIGRITAADTEGSWLEVDDVDLVWSPTALLDARIRIDRIGAARIALDRLPPSEPSAEPPEPIRLPELPSWLPPTTVQQLSVAQIDLGRDVLGQSAAFALSGGLDMPDDGGSATVVLDLERLDQTTAAVDLDATLQLEPPALDLALRAHEEGGLLAALTGQAQAGALTLELAGDGPLDDWQGTLDIDADGLARADATIDIALADQLALNLDATILPAEGVLPADIAAALGDRLGLAIAVTQTGAQQLEIEHLRATAANTELTGDGTVDLEAEQFQGALHLALADLAGLSTLAATPLAGEVRLDLTAEGGLLQPNGTLELEGTGLAAAGASVESLTTRLEFAAGEPLTDGIRGLALTGSGRTEGLAAPKLAPLPLDDLSWEIDVLARQEDAVELNLLRLSMADIVLAIQGEADPQTLAATGQVDLTVDSLARLAAPYGQAVDGGAALHVDLVTAEQAQQIEAKLSGTIDRLSGLPPGAAELLGSTVELAAKVTLRPETLVQVEDLSVSGAEVSLGGDLALTLPDQDLDGKLALRLPKLAVLEPVVGQPIGGDVEIDATIAGSVAEPDLQVAAGGRDVLIADRTIEKLALLATARGPTSEHGGKVELTLTTSGVEASLSTSYQLRDQTLALNDVTLLAPRSRVDGTLVIDLERTLIDGTIKGRVADLAGLRPLLPVPLRGAVDLDAELRPEAATQTVQVSLAVRDLVGDFGRLRRLQADATVTDALGTPGLEANASAREFRQGDVHVADLGLEVAGTLEQLRVRSTVAGEATKPFDLEARAQVALGQAIQVQIEQLSGEVAGKPLRLARTAEIVVGDEMRLSGLDLEAVGARLTADATMAAGQVTLDAALQNLSLGDLADLGSPVVGEANAQLRMRGSVTDPTADLDLSVTGLRAADPAFEDLPPARLTASAALASHRLRLDVRGEGVTDKPLVLTAALPVVLRLEPFAFETPDGPVEGQFDAELRLSRLADVAGLDDDRLEGLLDVGLSLGGTIQQPQLNGSVDLTDGIYENGLTGTVLHDMTLHATARQQRITIDELTANDGGNGRISGEGFIDIDPAAAFPMDVRVALRRAQLVQVTEANATISGDLALSGDVSAAKLDGTLTVDQAEIYLPDQVGPSVPTIEVEEAGAPAGDGASNSNGSTSAFDLALDVVVELPGRIFVRGRGLESEWQGRITATGTASRPILNGSITMRRGYFDLLGQRFDLRRGVIAFNGNSPPNPTIDLEATARAGDVTGIIRVEGPATTPTLTLESEPPLPQDEVLSRIMFNRAANEITPMQAVQLAAAVNRLRGGGPGVLDRLRSALGVDTLDVGGDEETGTTVRAGRYLSDNVYVEGETGTQNESSRARVEVEVLPNLSLQAETGTDANSGVGLKWRFDY